MKQPLMVDPGTMKRDESIFAQRVWKAVCAVPKGRVISYSKAAKRAGFPGAARAVGTLMKNNRDATRPCHRVIRSDGRVGEYNRGTAAKERRLRAEGVIIRRGRVCE